MEVDASEDEYHPPPDYKEDKKEPLDELSLTDSTELWLIQWPINQLQPEDFEGKELSLKLNRDGRLGTFESLSGKSYDVISFAAQEPDATVILASSHESKAVGKISRRVSFVHYPEPGEAEETKPKRPLQSSLRLSGSLRGSSDYSATPSQSAAKRSQSSASRLTQSAARRSQSSASRMTYSSQRKSSVTSSGLSSMKKEPSEKHYQHMQSDTHVISEKTRRSIDLSTQDSAVSSLGYLEAGVSGRKKSKKKHRTED